MAKEKADKPLDSTADMEARKAVIRAESARIEAEQSAQETARKQKAFEREQQMHQDEIESLERVSLISEGETRDMLLDRIRAMREDVPAGPPPPPPMTEQMLQQLAVEQALGRAMVARAEAEEERMREIRARIAAEERERSGTMTPVHHPNPSQEEMFPASGATLGKPRK